MDFLSLVVFLGASVGHVAILAYSLNWWYGLPLPHKLLSVLRFLHGILVVVGVAAFVCAWVFPSSFEEWLIPHTLARAIASGYTCACILVGGVVVPLITLRRSFRRRA